MLNVDRSVVTPTIITIIVKSIQTWDLCHPCLVTNVNFDFLFECHSVNRNGLPKSE